MADRQTKRRMNARERRETIERAATEVFAEHGYERASIAEIAKRSGVSAPVVYDHFDSKRALHAHLLAKHLSEMRGVWRQHLIGDEPVAERIAQALDGWFAYVESHPYAWRMVFRETSGDAAVKADHDRIQADSRRELVPLLAALPGAQELAGSADFRAQEMAIELLRAAIAGLALWWYEHRDIPREQVVAAAMNVLWLGFERFFAGERWRA